MKVGPTALIKDDTLLGHTRRQAGVRNSLIRCISVKLNMKWSSNLLVAVIAFATACDSPIALMEVANPSVQKAVPSAASTKSPLIIIQNPDGTFSVQKDGSRLDANGGTGKTGLVIPAQLVVPIVVKR
jgi:hypothetical protein